MAFILKKAKNPLALLLVLSLLLALAPAALADADATTPTAPEANEELFTPDGGNTGAAATDEDETDQTKEQPTENPDEPPAEQPLEPEPLGTPAAGRFRIDVQGGTASPAYANPGEIVTVTLDPAQIPEGKRFMIWQLAKLVEVEKTATTSNGTLAKTDGTVLQAAGVNLAADVSPFVDGTSLSSHEIKFRMPEETRIVGGTPENKINNYPDDTLWVSALYDTIAQPSDETYAIWQTSEWLYAETGVRLRGTPNEYKTADGLAAQFKRFGYADVTHYEPSFMTNQNVDAAANAGPSAGRVVFSETSRLGDMLGNANPNNAGFGVVTGQLVDFGTWVTDATDLDAPAITSGNVVAAVRFGFVPSGNAAAVTAAFGDTLDIIKTTLEGDYPGLNIMGFVWSRSAGTYNNQIAAPAAPALAGGLPNIAMPLHNLNRVVRDAEYFENMQWHGPSSTTNVVVAKKPAATNNPDLIVVLTAHMDTVLAATGANDNGSGVAVVMGLADYFKDKDLGNIEVWFAPNGSEEGNTMSGARFIVHRLMTPEQRKKAININFDMVGGPGWFSGPSWGLGGAPIDALTIDPDPQWIRNINQGYPQSLNLPSFLVSDGAKTADWAPGINNVRFNQVGGVDGARFAEAGIDSANLLFVTNFDDALEIDYHTGSDNFYDNLSYDRMSMAFHVVKNGIEKAAAQQVSKQAAFEIDTVARTMTLTQADRHFKIYDRIEATVDGKKITFSKNDAVPGVKAMPSDVVDPFDVSLVLAYGVGIADHADANRNVSLGLAPAADRNALGLAGVQLPLNTLLTRLEPSTHRNDSVHRPSDGSSGGGGIGGGDGALTGSGITTKPVTSATPPTVMTPTATRQTVTTPTLPAGTPVSASATSNTLIIKGESVTFPAANVGGYNYLRLRDLAMLLRDTDAAFNVTFDADANMVVVASGDTYAPTGTEMQTLPIDFETVASPQHISIDGIMMDIAAFNINGYNFFRLRDLAILLDFALVFDDNTGTVTLDFEKNYTE